MSARTKTKISLVIVTHFFALLIVGCGSDNGRDPLASTWKNLEATAAADPNLFASGLAGIAVVKPPEWRFVANDEISNVRGNIKLNKRDFQEMMRSVQLPVVSIMKYPDTYAGINPTVQIGVRSKKYYSKTNPMDLLNKIIAGMKSSGVVQDFSVIKDVHSLQIDGIPAATVATRFNIQLKSGKSVPVLSTLYYAKNSENIIIVGMSRRDSVEDTSEREFEGILKSLRLAR